MERINKMEQSVIEIRDAKPEDAQDIAAIQKAGWLATYVNTEKGITKEDIITKDFESQERIARWEEGIKNPEGRRMFIVKKDGKVVGFCTAGKETNINRLLSLYVLPEVHGHGLGSRLMQEALQWLGDEKDIVLDVVSYNQNAINFYEKHGFRKTDKHLEPFAFENGKVLPEIEMIRKV